MTTLPPSIKASITRFDEAVRDHAFKGTKDPLDYEEIEENYREKREQLENLIARYLERSKEKC